MKLPDDGFRLQIEGLTFEGRSRAGNETWIRVRELGLALDVGRGPDALVGTRKLFVSHVHLDHFAGVPVLISQRSLQSMEPPVIWLPRESKDLVADLIGIFGRLEGFEYPVELVGASRGDRFPLRTNLEARAHEATHRVPAVAWEFRERRVKLRPEYRHLPGEILGEMKRSRADVFEERFHSRLMYTGDTDREIFEVSPAIFDTDVAVVECTYVRESDRERGRQWQHLHADEIFEHAERFRGSVLMVHFSLRDSPAEIHATLSRRCPASLRGRLFLGLPSPFDSI